MSTVEQLTQTYRLRLQQYFRATLRLWARGQLRATNCPGRSSLLKWINISIIIIHRMSTATEVDGYCPLILNGVIELWQDVYEERVPIQSMMNIGTRTVFIVEIVYSVWASHIVCRYKKNK